MKDMKKYIAPDIECVELEPLQFLAASNTPNTDVTDRNEGFAPEGEGEAKQHTGAFDADWD